MTDPANLFEMLRERARLHPQRPAIVEERRVVDYATLAQQASCAAGWLERRGLVAGDGVLVLEPMSAALYALLLGAWSIGLVVQFIDPSEGLGHMEAACRLARPRVLFGTARAQLLALALPPLRKGLVRIHTGGFVPWSTPWRRLCEPAPARGCAIGGDAPALLTFTSGSTGTPKVIARSHAFLRLQHEALSTAARLVEGEIDLTTLPIFLLANLASGLTSIIPAGDLRRPARVDAERIAAQLEGCKPKRGGASPAFWQCLLAHPRARRQLAGFERIYTGGGPVEAELLRQLTDAAPFAQVVSVYGSSEAEPIAKIDAAEVLAEPCPDSLLPGGHVCAQIRCRVIRDQTGQPLGPWTASQLEDQTLPTGVLGEIIVAGPHVVKGYVDGRGDGETKIRVGDSVWHRTGDAGRVDSSGRLWLAGRCAAAVTVDGRRLYPQELTAALDAAGISRSALLDVEGVPTVAFEGSASSLETIRQALDARGWSSLVVRRVARIPLDRRHNSKTDYARLRVLLGR